MFTTTQAVTQVATQPLNKAVRRRLTTTIRLTQMAMWRIKTTTTPLTTANTTNMTTNIMIINMRLGFVAFTAHTVDLATTMLPIPIITTTTRIIMTAFSVLLASPSS